MSKHLTDGKITYIHGATPRRSDPPIEADMDRWREISAQRTTREQLEAGENDPALSQPIPAAPSVRYIGVDYASGPDYSVEGYYGADTDGPIEMAVADVEEYQIWPPDKNRSASSRRRINWYAVALWTTIILMCIMILTGVVGIASTIRFQDFLQNLAPGSK